MTSQLRSRGDGSSTLPISSTMSSGSTSRVMTCSATPFASAASTAQPGRSLGVRKLKRVLKGSSMKRRWNRSHEYAGNEWHATPHGEGTSTTSRAQPEVLPAKQGMDRLGRQVRAVETRHRARTSSTTPRTRGDGHRKCPSIPKGEARSPVDGASLTVVPPDSLGEALHADARGGAATFVGLPSAGDDMALRRTLYKAVEERRDANAPWDGVGAVAPARPRAAPGARRVRRPALLPPALPAGGRRAASTRRRPNVIAAPATRS